MIFKKFGALLLLLSLYAALSLQLTASVQSPVAAANAVCNPLQHLATQKLNFYDCNEAGLKLLRFISEGSYTTISRVNSGLRGKLRVPFPTVFGKCRIVLDVINHSDVQPISADSLHEPLQMLINACATTAGFGEGAQAFGPSFDTVLDIQGYPSDNAQTNNLTSSLPLTSTNDTGVTASEPQCVPLGPGQVQRLNVNDCDLAALILMTYFQATGARSISRAGSAGSIKVPAVRQAGTCVVGLDVSDPDVTVFLNVDMFNSAAGRLINNCASYGGYRSGTLKYGSAGASVIKITGLNSIDNAVDIGSNSTLLPTSSNSTTAILNAEPQCEKLPKGQPQGLILADCLTAGDNLVALYRSIGFNLISRYPAPGHARVPMRYDEGDCSMTMDIVDPNAVVPVTVDDVSTAMDSLINDCVQEDGYTAGALKFSWGAGAILRVLDKEARAAWTSGSTLPSIPTPSASSASSASFTFSTPNDP